MLTHDPSNTWGPCVFRGSDHIRVVHLTVVDCVICVRDQACPDLVGVVPAGPNPGGPDALDQTDTVLEPPHANVGRTWVEPSDQAGQVTLPRTKMAQFVDMRNSSCQTDSNEQLNKVVIGMVIRTIVLTDTYIY